MMKNKVASNANQLQSPQEAEKFFSGNATTTSSRDATLTTSATSSTTTPAESGMTPAAASEDLVEAGGRPDQGRGRRRSESSVSSKDSKSTFVEFCNSTSLHGWQYLGHVGSIRGRIVWLTIVMASLGVASVFLATAAKDFANRAVVTTIDTTTASLQVRLRISCSF